MSAKHTGVAAAGALLAVAAGVFLWRWWPTSPAPTDSRRAAEATSAGLLAGVRAARLLVEPYRCARPLDESLAGDAPGDVQHLSMTVDARALEARLTGQTLRIEPRRGPERGNIPARGNVVHIAVVADARGRFEHLGPIRDTLARRRDSGKAPIDLVVSLGGMARDKDAIQAALSALTGPWWVLALPGDRESYPDHRAAIQSLAHRGVLDGGRVRAIDLPGIARLATLPGAPMAGRSLAGVDGCVYTADDVARLGEWFARPAAPDAPPDAPRVLLAHAPPRQRGPAATDLTAAGVHVGEIALAEAMSSAGVALAVHGLVAPVHARTGGRAPLDPADPPAHPLVLAAGAADGLPDMAQQGKWPPLALVITLEADSVTWTHLEP